MSLSSTTGGYAEDEIIGEGDPLENLDLFASSPKYYRLNETVFAEPIEIQENIVDIEAGSEMCVIDNVMVEIRKGKRKKLYIDVDKNAAYQKCPQTQCNKTFSTTTLLRAHIRRVHCAERNKYMCEQCGAGFSARYLLQRHETVHSKKRVECSVCGNTLSRRTDMSAHLKSHFNIRQHACHLCTKTFVRRATLNAHVRFVHRTGDFRCHRCDKRFPTRKLLTTHKVCEA